MHVPHTYLYTTPDTKSKGKPSKKLDIFESFLWFLKTIWSLQEFINPLRDFLNLVFDCKQIPLGTFKFLLVVVYHPLPIWNIDRYLNNSKKTIVNMEKDLNSDMYCRWFQLEKWPFRIFLLSESYTCLSAHRRFPMLWLFVQREKLQYFWG